MMKSVIFFALLALAYSLPLDDYLQEQYLQSLDDADAYEFVGYQPLYRQRRFVSKVATENKGFKPPGQYEPPKGKTSISPHIYKDYGTTNVGVSGEHSRDNFDVNGHWNKNIAGPGKDKANWYVGGSVRF